MDIWTKFEALPEMKTELQDMQQRINALEQLWNRMATVLELENVNESPMIYIKECRKRLETAATKLKKAEAFFSDSATIEDSKKRGDMLDDLNYEVRMIEVRLNRTYKPFCKALAEVLRAKAGVMPYYSPPLPLD